VVSSACRDPDCDSFGDFGFDFGGGIYRAYVEDASIRVVGAAELGMGDASLDECELMRGS
jgi:hypothetical protein